MKARSAIDLALRCYPGWWRERYADEVRVVSQDLAADGKSTARVSVNLMMGAVRARSRAQGMPMSYGLWSVRTRTSIAGATLPWLLIAPLMLFAVGNVDFRSSAGTIFFTGNSVLPSHLQVIKDGTPVPAPPLTPIVHLVLYSSLAMTLLFLLTLIVLTSGWSGLTGAIRRSTTSHRRRLRLLAWAPIFAILTDVALLITQDKMRPDAFSGYGSHVVASGGNPTALHVLDIVVPTVAIVGWLVSVACVAVASRRAEVAPADLRFGKSVSTTVAVLFALLVAAYATWGIGLIVQAHEAANSNFTTVGYSHPDLWLPMMLVLTTAVAVSVASARAARSSWKVISTTLL